MCQAPSWITTPDAVLFLTDKDAEDHRIDWKDATGHSAIRKVWPNCKGQEGEGLGKHTPQVVVDALLAGKLNRIVAAGELVVTDGVWELPAAVSGYVVVYQGATFNAQNLARCGSVSVEKGATLNAPVLSEVSGYVYVEKGATFNAQKLKR